MYNFEYKINNILEFMIVVQVTMYYCTYCNNTYYCNNPYYPHDANPLIIPTHIQTL